MKCHNICLRLSYKVKDNYFGLCKYYIKLIYCVKFLSFANEVAFLFSKYFSLNMNTYGAV